MNKLLVLFAELMLSIKKCRNSLWINFRTPPPSFEAKGKIFLILSSSLENSVGFRASWLEPTRAEIQKYGSSLNKLARAMLLRLKVLISFDRNVFIFMTNAYDILSQLDDQ